MTFSEFSYDAILGMQRVLHKHKLVEHLNASNKELKLEIVNLKRELQAKSEMLETVRDSFANDMELLRDKLNVQVASAKAKISALETKISELSHVCLSCFFVLTYSFLFCFTISIILLTI
jgi:predicted RNase H-like nuclease (RuvC/YqgF family)